MLLAQVTKSQPEKIAQNVTAAASRKSACQNPSSVTNACLRELYQTDSYRLQSKGNANKIGITAYLGERANYQDLKDFLKREGLPTTNNFTVVSVNGGTNPQEFTPDEISRRVGAEVSNPVTLHQLEKKIDFRSQLTSRISQGKFGHPNHHGLYGTYAQRLLHHRWDSPFQT